MSWGQVVILDSELDAKSLNLGLSNCFPLSDTRAFATPNLQILDHQTKLRTFYSVIVANFSASTHLVK